MAENMMFAPDAFKKSSKFHDDAERTGHGDGVILSQSGGPRLSTAGSLYQGEWMSDLGMILATVFGGVVGGAIGFLLIAFVAMVLALPYIIMIRHPPVSHEDEAVPSKKY